jgi:hypothetical protein
MLHHFFLLPFAFFLFNQHLVFLNTDQFTFSYYTICLRHFYKTPDILFILTVQFERFIKSWG